MDYIKGEDRNQYIMFPNVLDDYIDESNPVRVIDAFIDCLDLKMLGLIKLKYQTQIDLLTHLKIY